MAESDAHRASDRAPELPRAVELAWNPARETTKGPKPRWTLEQILDAAVELGDRGGVEAITMSGLAKALGSGTMSMYRYVESREDLVILAANRALESQSPVVGGSWRERLRRWVLDLRKQYQAHPWLTALPIASEPLLPSYVRRLDAGLGCLDELDLSGSAAISILTLLWTYTRGDVEQSIHLNAAAESHREHAGDINGLAAQRLRVLDKNDEFPRLLAILETADEQLPADATAGDEPEFLYAVDLILDGIQSRLPEVVPSPRG